MTPSTVLGLLLAAAPASMETAVATYSKAYNSAFDRLKAVELSDTQTRITRLGAKGKALQPNLDELRRRQGEVSDALVKAVQLGKRGRDEKRAEVMEQASAILRDADAQAQRLLADVKSLTEKLTAAGAPVIDPGPPRDPNARD